MSSIFGWGCAGLRLRYANLMRPNQAIRPPVAVLPPPDETQLRILVVLCRSRPALRVRSFLRAPVLVRILACVYRMILGPLRKLVARFRPYVVATEGARPPPLS